MMATPKMKSDGRTVTVRVPISIRKRGGRKIVLAPSHLGNISEMAVRGRVEMATVKAIARGFRWRQMLEDCKYGSIRELAEAEQISDSYVSRILRLTLLAPCIVESLVNGQIGGDVSVRSLTTGVPPLWRGQDYLSEKLGSKLRTK
jgi:hypothetical protein